jgi:hypothetical protein
MHNYKKIVGQIRKKSFPEIKGKIWIIKIPFLIPGAGVFWLFPRVNILALSTKCSILTKKELRGLIPHELSHMSNYQKNKWIGFCFDLLKYICNRKYTIENEKNADLLTIKKGYGKELVAIKKKGSQICKGTKFEKIFNHYMTVDEVEQHIQKSKK